MSDSAGTILRTLPETEWVRPHLVTATNYAFADLDEATINRMSVAVYNFPPPSFRGCYGMNCPVDAAGSHAIHVMSGVRVCSIFGKDSDEPVIDGLPTQTIVDIKAHAVATNDASNLDCLQHLRLRLGQPDSIGGVLFRVPLPLRGIGEQFQRFRFIVAASGANRINDDFIARAVGNRIVKALLEEGLIPLGPPVSETFIVGVSLREVAEYVEARSLASQ